MGNFYVNFTVPGVIREEVVSCLRALQRSAYVSPSLADLVVFYDEEADSQGQALTDLGLEVSKALDTEVFAVGNHDDDILFFSLFSNGQLKSSYDSYPGYFGDGDKTPIGVDAEALCMSFGVSDEDVVEEVDAILSDEDDYVFALDRHKELADCLKIPWQFACMGYRYIAEGMVAEGIKIEELTRISKER